MKKGKIRNQGYTYIYKKIDLNRKLKGEFSFLIYRLKWNLSSRRVYLPQFPLHLDIELTNICNLKCSMCFQKYMKSNKGLMKWALYKKIIDEGAVKGLAAIKLQVRGESFLHPDLMRCIKYAKEKGIMDVQITTNGTLLDEEKSRKIIESGLDMIIFSLDSNHRISYENSGKNHTMKYFRVYPTSSP